MTTKQAEALRYIQADPMANCKMFAREVLHNPKSTLQAGLFLGSLVRKGWLKRYNDYDPKKYKQFTVTEAGVAALDQFAVKEKQ